MNHVYHVTAFLTGYNLALQANCYDNTNNNNNYYHYYYHNNALYLCNYYMFKESNTHKLKMVVLKSLTPMEIGKRNASLIPAIYKQVQSIVQKTSRYGVTVTCRYL